MLKIRVKQLLQKILGFDNYLFVFSVFTINMLRFNKNEREFVYFLSLLPGDELLLDVGANIGIMTVPLSKKAAKGKVYAFEPMPQNITALKRVINYYKSANVTLFETALGSETGELKMIMPVHNGILYQGLCHVVDDNDNEEGKHFSVPVKKLDDIPELQNTGAIGGIKIDVENFELEVFKGAEKLLHKHKPIIYCELWNNEKRAPALNYMQNEFGYLVKIYDGKNLVPFNNQEAINFFFMPF